MSSTITSEERQQTAEEIIALLTTALEQVSLQSEQISELHAEIVSLEEHRIEPLEAQLAELRAENQRLRDGSGSQAEQESDVQFEYTKTGKKLVRGSLGHKTATILR